MKKKYLIFALAGLLVSCGDEGKKKDEKEPVKIGTKTSPKKEDTKGTILALSGNDLMQFDKNELTVTSGEEVTLTLRHTGKIDKKVMGHNFVLLKPGTSIPEFAAKAAAAGEAKDWIPEGDEVIVHTQMIGGGGTASISFPAPEPGTYDYICSFPGHSGLMNGKLIVL